MWGGLAYAVDEKLKRPTCEHSLEDGIVSAITMRKWGRVPDE